MVSMQGFKQSVTSMDAASIFYFIMFAILLVCLVCVGQGDLEFLMHNCDHCIRSFPTSSLLPVLPIRLSMALESGICFFYTTYEGISGTVDPHTCLSLLYIDDYHLDTTMNANIFKAYSPSCGGAIA